MPAHFNILKYFACKKQITLKLWECQKPKTCVSAKYCHGELCIGLHFLCYINFTACLHLIWSNKSSDLIRKAGSGMDHWCLCSEILSQSHLDQMLTFQTFPDCLFLVLLWTEFVQLKVVSYKSVSYCDIFTQHDDYILTNSLVIYLLGKKNICTQKPF